MTEQTARNKIVRRCILPPDEKESRSQGETTSYAPPQVIGRTRSDFEIPTNPISFRFITFSFAPSPLSSSCGRVLGEGHISTFEGTRSPPFRKELAEANPALHQVKKWRLSSTISLDFLHKRKQ